ncbi:hypothetical protein JOD63_002944 [Microbacterium terrae]|uniref:Uncharacterized protein n=1 Tax=Microbacterium terrae TaxID=69369 RepID=A0A0M2H2B4_9MICO|nr:hypothetical protein [Microbacterium terrae]KJL38382.1 hypothetical protein RS81_02653 [Microbacterium terrae]MBP1078976.1 hypothetical protein [Microbacterium terrae]GLJ98376.1 hypothetical protein GCM10017594_15730 [Microbacterium terrae]
MRRYFSWRWLGVSLTVIGLGAAFLAAREGPFPSTPVGLTLVWAGLAMFVCTLIAPAVMGPINFVREVRMYGLVNRWHKNGAIPADYPEWVRRRIYADPDGKYAPQWEVSRAGKQRRLRNTGVDAHVEVTRVSAIGPVAIELDLDLSMPAVIPREASFALTFIDERAGFGDFCAVLVKWTRPSGGDLEEVFYL